MMIKKEELGYYYEEECYIFDIVLEKLKQHFIIYYRVCVTGSATPSTCKGHI